MHHEDSEKYSSTFFEGDPEIEKKKKKLDKKNIKFTEIRGGSAGDRGTNSLITLEWFAPKKKKKKKN